MIGSKTGNNETIVERKYFENWAFDSSSRQLNGTIDWRPEEGWNGDFFWDYLIEFSENFSKISRGILLAYKDKEKQNYRIDYYGSDTESNQMIYKRKC